MDDLPAELLHLLLDQCDHASLKNLRSVCHAFGDAVTPLVFEHFYMSLFAHSLANLEALAKSRVAKHVKKFTFCSDALPSWVDERNEWEQSIDFRPDRARVSADGRGTNDLLRGKDYDERPRHDLTEQQLDDGWNQFTLARKQQDMWCWFASPRLRFKEYFAYLPNVVQVAVTTAQPFQGRNNSLPIWKRLRPVILVGPEDFIYRTDYLDDQHRAMLSGIGFLCVLEAIGFRASFAGTKPITRVKAVASHAGSLGLVCHKLSCTAQPDISWPAVQQNLREAFRWLTSVTLHMPAAAHNGFYFDDGRATGEEIVDFLHAATQLKSLDLTYHDDKAGMTLLPLDMTPSITPLFTTQPPWAQIEHLALCVDVASEHLLPFFKHISPTLTSLKLVDMNIDDPKSFLVAIPQVLKLQHIYLECLWYTHDTFGEDYRGLFPDGTDGDGALEAAVKAYVLRESDKFPDLELCTRPSSDDEHSTER